MIYKGQIVIIHRENERRGDVATLAVVSIINCRIELVHFCSVRQVPFLCGAFLFVVWIYYIPLLPAAECYLGIFNMSREPRSFTATSSTQYRIHDLLMSCLRARERTLRQIQTRRHVDW